jgi:DNA polymerase III alpha subunit (gram-positive type)
MYSKRPTRKKQPSTIKQHNTMHFVVDLETTGFSKECNYIIKIACECVHELGAKGKESEYQSLVKPPTPIPWDITQINGSL